MKAANMDMFREKQLFISGLLLFVFMSAVSANKIVDRIAILDRTVELSCSLPTYNQTVTWEVDLSGIATRIATCHVNTADCETDSRFSIISKATKSNNSFTVSISFDVERQEQIHCLLGGVIQQTFNVSVIEVPVISPPNCSIIPTTSHQGRDVTLTFSCKSYVPPKLPYLLTMFGFSENISTSGWSDLNVENDVDVENFRENLNVVCELRISDVDISESCNFPHSTNVTYTPDVTDAVFDCYVDPGDAATWRLLDLEGREEDMAGRSWIRDGGSSLLIKNIEQDIGKVAECRINGSVGFGVIYGIGSSGNDRNNGSTPTYASRGDRLVYVVLTFVFGCLLLLTLLIVVSHWRCGACEQPMKWYAQFKPHGKPKTSTTNQLSGSPTYNLTFSVGGSNSRRPDDDVVTIPESNINSSNQNNSALNHPRDPTPQMKATSSLDAGASSSVSLTSRKIENSK